jgi:NDP-sugar pyrophosphorylase family protein
VESESQDAYFSFATMMKKLKDNPEIPSGAVRAFVLCGGAGTRLRPVLADRPKSMALIGGMPFLQLLIERLRCQGVDDVILGTGYMAEKIESYFGSGNKLAMRIHYSREHKPLGTGGAVKLAEPLISDPVLILNGDSYVEWNLVPMLELFRAKDADMVVVLHAVADVTRYGSVALDHDGRVTQFIEKGIRAGPGLINAGVYLLRKEIVRDLPASQAISLERDVFPSLLHHRVYGLVCDGLFIDIGIPDDLRQAQTLLAPHPRVEKPSHN